MARLKGSKSPASRENGKKGGRPVDSGTQLPREMLAQLGPAPIGNPIKLARWYTSALALLTQRRLAGHTRIDKLAQEVRANAAAAAKVLPHDIIFSAAKVVRDDEDELAADGGPEEETVVRAPSGRRAYRTDA